MYTSVGRSICGEKEYKGKEKYSAFESALEDAFERFIIHSVTI